MSKFYTIQLEASAYIKSNLSNRILTLNKKAFWKHDRKGRKCWLSAFSPVLIMSSNLSKTEIIIWATFISSSANAFNLNQSKILLFGKELNVPYIVVFVSDTVKNAGYQYFSPFNTRF